MSKINQTWAIKTKVIFGFSLVFIAFIAASYFAYVSFNKLLYAVEVIAQPDKKLLHIDSILVTVTRTENTLQEYTVSKSNDKLERYYQQISLIDEQIKQLKHDVEYKEDKKLDSVLNLLNVKLVSFKSFLEIQEGRDNFDFYNKALKELEEQIQSEKEIQSDSSNITSLEEDEERRTVWNRLFSRKDPASEKIKESLPNADSVFRLNADSVRRILRGVRAQQTARQRSLNQQELQYLSNNAQVMDNIYQLVRQIKHEQQANSETRSAIAKQTLEDSLARIGIVVSLVLICTAIIIYLIFADITKSDYYRRKLQLAKQEAERLARVKEDFLANMSHEIRTPLTAILGFTKQLKETPLNSQQSEYLNAVDNSSEHLLSLVNDILDFSKIEAGELKFEKSAFDIIQVIQQVHTDLLPQAQKKSLAFDYIAKGEEFGFLQGDAFRLKQVLYNLIYNAIKFTDQGKVSVTCWLEPVNRNLTKAQIIIEDTGVGIPPDKLKEIFGAFSQTDVSNTRKYGGTGLGLTISKKLVEAQGGRIKVSSEVGKGSVFTVLLPFEKSSKEAVYANIRTAPKLVDNFAGYKILVIDDDPLNTRLVEVILKKWGMQPFIAHSGTEGIRCYKEQSFDLILCDLQMPEMDGETVAREIRALEKNADMKTPFIAFTARILKDDWEQYQAAGMDGYLLKPFNEEEIYQLLSKYFELKKKASVVEEKKFVEQPGLSLKNIKKFTGEDEEALVQYLESFLSVNTNNLDCLKKALQDENLQDASFYAHKMIPGIQQLEVNELAAILRKLELLSSIQAEWDHNIAELVQQAINQTQPLIKLVKDEIELLSQKVLKS